MYVFLHSKNNTKNVWVCAARRGVLWSTLLNTVSLNMCMFIVLVVYFPALSYGDSIEPRKKINSWKGGRECAQSFVSSAKQGIIRLQTFLAIWAEIYLISILCLACIPFASITELGFFTVASDLNGGGSCMCPVGEYACKNGTYPGCPLHNRDDYIVLHVTT